MRHATIRQLQIFAEAARTGSFARVAERLHLTPAAVSFQIRQLESISGFELFEHVGKKPVLTDPGHALLGYAQTILQALNDADLALRMRKGLSGGRVSVGLVSTAKYIVPHMLSRFRADYPAVTIHLRDGNRREIFEALAKGEVDMAITGRPPEGVVLKAEPLADHPSVIIASPTHPLAGYDQLPLASLGGEAFIGREEGSGTRQLMEGFFRAAGISARITMTSSSNETIKQAVMAGMGLALLSRHTIGLELHLGLLRILPIEGLPLMRSWFVAHRPGMPLLPIHARLRDFLLQRGAAIIDELEQSWRAISLPPTRERPLERIALAWNRRAIPGARESARSKKGERVQST